MSHVVALMYHALYDGEDEYDSISMDERPYAVSVSEFNKQIDAIEKAGITILDPQVLQDASLPDNLEKGVVLTFDDGHKSFYYYAYRILKSRGYRAIFFITSDLIDDRDDFCSWDNLKTMANDGFMVQPHGKTHHFLPDLDAELLSKEFVQPKLLLEKKTGQKVITMSFPGGRYGKREIQDGIKYGYKNFFTSQVGIISNSTINKRKLFNRVPVRNAMTIDEFMSLAQGEISAILPRKIIYHLKAVIKLVLGNHIYHVLYQKLFN